jgi:hypothetical protein
MEIATTRSSKTLDESELAVKTHVRFEEAGVFPNTQNETNQLSHCTNSSYSQNMKLNFSKDKKEFRIQ